MFDDATHFTSDDLRVVGDDALQAWRAGLDRDWGVSAGTLEWSCFATADHTIDCVFSYAQFLASRVTEAYPPFSEVHALPGATPKDLVDGFVAMTNLLRAIVVTTPPEVRAILFGRAGLLGEPDDFAARGAHEFLIHTHDICAGLGVDFVPPVAECGRLRDHTAAWPVGPTVEPTADPWSDLLERSGRARLTPRS